MASLKKGYAKHPSQKSRTAGAKASSHQPGTFQLTLVARRREGASVARLEARLATHRGLPLSRARRLARRVSRWLEVSAACCALSRALRVFLVAGVIVFIEVVDVATRKCNITHFNVKVCVVLCAA